MENEENKVVEQTTQEQPIVDNAVDKIKVKPKKFAAPEESVAKVDLSKPVEDEKPEQTPVENATADDAGVVGSDESTNTTPQQKEIQPETETQEQPVLEEVTEETVKQESFEETVIKAEEQEAIKAELPQNVDKLVEFMNETGGTLEDYVMLNRDYSQMDNLTALEEYYKITKPHLDAEERAFLMEENFSFDEDVDDDKVIKRKKIALKEQVAEAKAYLDGQKSRYYDEIKAGSKLPPEAKKAMDFFNRYNEESEQNQKKFEQVNNVFKSKTEKVFNNFKGFEYKVGEKKFRFNVKDVDGVKETQSDINNFVKKFLNEEGSMEDAAGYHKSLYTAMNPDSVAQHFYEQGKADALKESVKKAKNINMDARQAHNEVNIGGTKFRVLNAEAKRDFKIKRK